MFLGPGQDLVLRKVIAVIVVVIIKIKKKLRKYFDNLKNNMEYIWIK